MNRLRWLLLLLLCLSGGYAGAQVIGRPGHGAGVVFRSPQGFGFITQKTFEIKFRETGPGAGVNALDPSLCINSTCVTPNFRYKLGDCDADECPAWTYGETLPDANTGGTAVTPNAGSPLLGSNDDSVDFNAGEVYQASDADVGDIAEQDFVIELIFETPNSAAMRPIGTFNATAGGAGWDIKLESSGTSLRATLADGTTTVQPTSTSALIVGGWVHVMMFVNDDENSTNGVRFAVNGNILTTSNSNASTVGDMTASGNLTIGADSGFTSSTEFDGRIAYAAMWKQADWHQAGASGPTEWATVASERFARLLGLYPTTANGTATPSTMSRGSLGRLRKTTSGVTTIYTAGSNWPRIETTSGSITGIMIEEDDTNLLVQSEDVSTSWTEIDSGDTQSLNSVVAPDGATTADGNIADATDGEHGFSQAATLTATTYTLSVFAKAGNQDWVYISDDTVANATGYFNASTCAKGTIGAGATNSFVESYGNGWCRVSISFTGTAASHTLKIQSATADTDNTFAGDGSTVNTTFWGMQVAAAFRPSSYIATAASTGTRADDRLEYSGTDNVNATGGSGVVEFVYESMDLLADTFLLSISNGGSAANTVRWVVLSSSDAHRFQGVVSSAQWSISGSTDIADGSRHIASGSWVANDFKMYINGAVEGTPDTSGSVPSYNEIEIGSLESTAQQSGALIERVTIHARREVKK